MEGQSRTQNTQKTKFCECMQVMRRDYTEVDSFIKLLGCIPDNDESKQCRDFYISCTIIFLKEYCQNDDDYEFVLATYGFLKGFEYNKVTPLGKRVRKYWQYACQYETHEFIKSNWDIDSVPTLLRNEHFRIINYLDEIFTEKNGKWEFIDKVPDKLEFPEPRKIEKPLSSSKEVPQSTLPPLINDDIEDTVCEDIQNELSTEPGDKTETNSIEVEAVGYGEGDTGLSTDSRYNSDDEEGNSELDEVGSKPDEPYQVPEPPEPDPPGMLRKIPFTALIILAISLLLTAAIFNFVIIQTPHDEPDVSYNKEVMALLMETIDYLLDDLARNDIPDKNVNITIELESVGRITISIEGNNAEGSVRDDKD